jgi:hypothetical protein
METIQATVNRRLLSKASRLFTGSLQGRIIELLQNARRAGATRVEITIKNGEVTVRDNGSGVEDFAKLLDLGASGWMDAYEVSEDPAGVGIFCLAPRTLTIRSKGKMATIESDGWTGASVPIEKDPNPVDGTALVCEDESWSHTAVDINAVFCGMDVTVDGTACPHLPFLSDQAAPHPELGCRIEVRESKDLGPWHHSVKRERWHYTNAIVNFHGQVICFACHPITEHGLQFLIDMTGDPTGIRLMLPARTCLVENEALEALKAALELDSYRYVQRRGHHSLPYKEFVRAKELGIGLPESKPTYSVGLLSTGDAPEPVEVISPDGFPLEKCYRCDDDGDGVSDSDCVNIHVLAALGKFDSPFVPVSVRKSYDGYSWAKMRTVEQVEVKTGKMLHKDWLWSGTLTCVDSIVITVRTSDGKVFTSPVCIAINPAIGEKQSAEDCVLVTPAAEEQLQPSEIWYHLGGWSDEGDTYDTQAQQFEEDLERFWVCLVGPDEQRRRSILNALRCIKPEWQSVTISSDGVVRIRHTDGSEQTLQPPKTSNGQQPAK